MTCRWIGRPNLKWYCATCTWWTRSGCILDARNGYNRDYSNNHAIPSKFPKGEKGETGEA